MENKLFSLFTNALQSNFKHFNVKFQSADEAENAQQVLQQELQQHLDLNGGKALGIRRLSRTELLVFLVTRAEDVTDWRPHILQILLRHRLKFTGVSHLSLQNTRKAQTAL